MYWLFVFIIDPLSGNTGMISPSAYGSLELCRQAENYSKRVGYSNNPQYMYQTACVSEARVEKAFEPFRK